MTPPLRVGAAALFRGQGGAGREVTLFSSLLCLQIERRHRIVVEYAMKPSRFASMKWRLFSASMVVGVAVAIGGEPAVVFDIQPRVLAVGETAVATIVLRNLPEAPAMSFPAIEGFTVQPAGVEERVEMSGGSVDRSRVYRFAMIAVKAGDYAVGPFSLEVGGRTWELPAIRLSVVPASAQSGAVDEARAMARLRLSKASVYVHEPFMIEVDLLYRGVELDRQIELQNMPTAGLKLEPFAELPARREAIEGQVYEVRTFRAQARALNSGELVLEPVLRAQVIVRRGRRSRDPWMGPSLLEEFFSGTPFDRVQRQAVSLAASPVVLTVRPLPLEGRPESFSGAVGACTWDVEVRPTEVVAGEPITITMTVRGDANLEIVQAPALRLGPEFRVYEPRLVPRPGRDQRERVFEQIVIPRDETARELPPLAFSYFDPEVGQYRELVRGPFPLVVRAATNGTASLRPMPMSVAHGSRIVAEAAELAYLKPVRMQPRRAVQMSLTTRMAVLAAPPVLAGAMIGWVRRRERLASDVALARRARAPRVAREAIRRMRAALEASEPRGFYDAMWSALTGFFGDRLNLPPGEVDADRVLVALGPTIEEPLRRDIADLFSQCAAVRFGGTEATGTDRRALLEKLLDVLRRCERVRT